MFMVRILTIPILSISLFTPIGAYDQIGFVAIDYTIDQNNESDNKNEITSNRIKITVNSKAFYAKLNDNPTVTALRAMLPLTLDMEELNGNEKFFHFSKDLPSNPVNPGTIYSGDLMLWGRNSLVLFYKTFSTSFNYTSLGRIDNPEGLATAVGAGNVTVKFEIE